jgi:YHS domain-containing protein
MTTKDLLVGFGAVALVQGVAVALHAHQTGGTQAPAVPLTSCAQVQPAIDNIIAEAMRRLEGARQTNDPAQMRAAVDHFANALRDIRTQLAPCAAPAAAADPHAGHAMPKTAPPAAAGVSPAKPAAVADPHAGHQTPAAKAARTLPGKPRAAAAKPKTTTAKAPAKTSDPHAAHPEPAEAKKEMDPVNGLTVDPSTAPKTTHQGRTYYFSSEQSLKQFLENPAKFAKPVKK